MSGNMSTSIDELPGPLPDEYLEEEINEIENEVNEHGIEVGNMEIKKSKQFKKPSFFQIINKEFNEENILIFIILFAACLPQITEYTVHLIMITPLKNFLKSNITISLFKCFLLLVIFLIIKNQVIRS